MASSRKRSGGQVRKDIVGRWWFRVMFFLQSGVGCRRSGQPVAPRLWMLCDRKRDSPPRMREKPSHAFPRRVGRPLPRTSSLALRRHLKVIFSAHKRFVYCSWSATSIGTVSLILSSMANEHRIPSCKSKAQEVISTASSIYAHPLRQELYPPLVPQTRNPTLPSSKQESSSCTRILHTKRWSRIRDPVT